MRHLLARFAEWIRTRLGLVDLDDELPPPLPAPEPASLTPAFTTKLPAAAFGRLTKSDIWSAPEPVRVVWLTLLVVADSNGGGKQSMRELAALADVDYDTACRAVEHLVAVGRLETQLFGGGWRITNYSSYHDVRPSPAAS